MGSGRFCGPTSMKGRQGGEATSASLLTERPSSANRSGGLGDAGCAFVVTKVKTRSQPAVTVDLLDLDQDGLNAISLPLRA